MPNPKVQIDKAALAKLEKQVAKDTDRILSSLTWNKSASMGTQVSEVRRKLKAKGIEMTPAQAKAFIESRTA